MVLMKLGLRGSIKKSLSYKGKENDRMATK